MSDKEIIERLNNFDRLFGILISAIDKHSDKILNRFNDIEIKMFRRLTEIDREINQLKIKLDNNYIDE